MQFIFFKCYKIVHVVRVRGRCSRLRCVFILLTEGTYGVLAHTHNIEVSIEIRMASSLSMPTRIRKSLLESQEHIELSQGQNRARSTWPVCSQI